MPVSLQGILFIISPQIDLGPKAEDPANLQEQRQILNALCHIDTVTNEQVNLGRGSLRICQTGNNPDICLTGNASQQGSIYLRGIRGIANHSSVVKIPVAPQRSNSVREVQRWALQQALNLAHSWHTC
jgi:hypothetical protein